MHRLIALLFVTSLFGQDAALVRLKREMAIARTQEEREQYPRAEGTGAARIANVHAALRAWLEPQLPKDVYSLAGEIPRLEASLAKALLDAGLSKPGSDDRDFLDDPGFDEVGIEFKTMPELPGTLFVTAGVKVPCGGDAAVYAYHFDSNGRALVIADHPKSDTGYDDAKLELSDRDSQGRRLLLIRRTSTQCASFRMGMTYAVYRMSLSQPAVPLLSSKHGFWLDQEIFVLKPDELMIELVDTGVDTERRAEILRYNFADGVKRIDPMALRPQDFAEEWLTRPWSEMRSRSMPETQKWHLKLHADFVLGQYSNVVLCEAKPDRWSIGLGITHIGEEELKEPIGVHLLVRDLGNYRFEMEAVSDSEFEGCPGDGQPSDKHPWLSAEQLKALP